MTGKTKKQILQELEESQKRIQELQQEADRLKNYSFIHESDQKLIHNLRLQAEGHKYAINLLREKNIQLKKEASELQAQISAKNEEEVNQFIEQIKAERDESDKKLRQMKAQLKNSRNISFLNSLEERCAALENEKKCLEEYKFFLENEVKELKFQIEGYENHFQELGKTLEKSSDYYIKTIKELQEENRKLWSSSSHNNRNAGRKKNNEEIRKRYLTFCSLMKKKTSMKDIMEIMQISRSTYYRVLKEYKIKSEDLMRN